MQVTMEVKSVDQKRYRKGPSVDQPYTTLSGLDASGHKPWLRQVLEVRCDPPRTDIVEGDKIGIIVSGISVYNGVAQFDGDIQLEKK